MPPTSRSVDYQKLYSFSDAFATRPLRLKTVEDQGLEQGYAWPLSDGTLHLAQPLKLRGYMGGQAVDVLWSGLVVLFCVSSRVVDLLRAEGITGWDTFPVEVYDRRGGFLPGYHGFAITGPTCRRDKSRSTIVAKPPPPPTPTGRGGKVYRGLYFHEADWDGSDFFWVDNCGGRVVTERVYRLFRRHKIGNVRFVPLPEVELDVLLDKYEKS
ncbi:MAG: hypothetical protein ACYC4R_11630 [Anaerolineae bacterium]